MSNEVTQSVSETMKGATIVYAPRSTCGKCMTLQLRYLGEKAEYLEANTMYPLRVGIMERFRDGKTRILVNVDLLVEGVDCPAAVYAVLTAPVGSDLLFQKMVGRVLRGPRWGASRSVISGQLMPDFTNRRFHIRTGMLSALAPTIRSG